MADPNDLERPAREIRLTLRPGRDRADDDYDVLHEGVARPCANHRPSHGLWRWRLAAPRAATTSSAYCEPARERCPLTAAGTGLFHGMVIVEGSKFPGRPDGRPRRFSLSYLSASCGSFGSPDGNERIPAGGTASSGTRSLCPTVPWFCCLVGAVRPLGGAPGGLIASAPWGGSVGG
jgi:hypothetical protein